LPAGVTTCTDAQKLSAVDQWLFANSAPPLGSAVFSNSLQTIVFDEAEDTGITDGGGHVPAILVSTTVPSGYQFTTLYQ